MHYLEWNAKLAAHFFAPEFGGKPVYLYATESSVNEIGAQHGVDFADLVAALKRGPPWASGSGLCARAYQAFEGWRDANQDWPPYIAYLVVFVAAAGVEGQFAANAYYGRLRTLTGEPPGGTLPSFEKMRELWEDLETWSVDEKKGALGVFRARTIGGWIHVGLPKAQALLTEAERRLLPVVFADADLDPLAPPSDRSLGKILIQSGTATLRLRTIETLKGGAGVDAELRAALLSTIIEELQQWDGTIPEMDPEKTSNRLAGQLKLFCLIDRTSGHAKMVLRCAVTMGLPEGGLTLAVPGTGERFRCEEELSGVSGAITNEVGGAVVDASQFDWVGGLVMADTGGRWRFRLPSGGVRVFVNAAQLGLPGLMEVRQLPRELAFVLMVHAPLLATVKAWLGRGCEDAKELRLQSGLPSAWRAFEVRRATSDAGVSDQFSVLSFQTTLQIRLVGGLRADAASGYFDFAPPLVVLEGGTGEERLFADGEPLDPMPDTNLCALAAGTPTGPLSIEARHGTDVVARRTLTLTEADGSPMATALAFQDCFGADIDRVDLASGSAHGALVFPAPEGVDPSYFVLPSWREEHRYLLGSQPGQVVRWPEESEPRDWSPVWAITRGRRKRAYYCGISIPGDAPTESSEGDLRRRKLWRELLWCDRKRIVPPRGSRVDSLWRRYQEVAFDV